MMFQLSFHVTERIQLNQKTMQILGQTVKMEGPLKQCLGIKQSISSIIPHLGL